DAVFDHIHMICNDYNDWTLQTLKTIIDIPEIEWLVKIHPAEAIWNPESGVLKFIQDNFNTLPKHVKIVLPDNSISPLNFFEFLDGVVTVGGTAGLEMATMGKPVIISGSTHYGMKGFTYDAANINEYVSFLKGTDTLKELDKNQIEIAQKYAYCYFLLRQIPLPLFRMTDSQYCFIQRNDIDILLPHMNDFYDFLCNEIVHGDDFIMPENLVTLLDDRF
ncbi:MAG: hypothetical protein FJ241_11895, partial [Nitrospira sp.]|nr:hypothetical protein [Nitrospira sp.]